MCKFIILTAHALAWEAIYGFLPPMAPAAAAGEFSKTGDFVVSASLLAAFSLAVACCLWAVSERARACAFRRSARDEAALARTAIGLRDAVIRDCLGDLVISGPHLRKPLSFGAASAMLEAAESGPDSVALAAAREELIESGHRFSLTARTQNNRAVALCGRPVGGHAVLLLDADEPAPTAENPRTTAVDYAGLLDALPIPAWIRGEDMKLAFVNRAFLEYTGAKNASDALATGIALDPCEAELASDARDSGESVTTKRYVTVGRSRRAVSFSFLPLPHGGVMGTALEIGLTTDPAQKDVLDGLGAALNRVSEAVAIYGADRRLVYYNDAYAQLWSLPKAWLDTGPARAQILDRLRETQRLPEQHDFLAWKAAQLEKFSQSEPCSEELWHLPGRKNVRVVVQRRPNGGLMFFFQDVTQQLDLQSALTAKSNVQKAALELHPDAVAIFGADGRLRFSNGAFSRLWDLPPHKLFGEPHMSRIAEDCKIQFGEDGTWDLVSLGVNSAAFEQQGEPIEIKRSDARIISVLFKRLPDGSTFVGFVDVTDQSRLEAVLQESAA